ncbi:MFS transporter [Streptomyces sp. NPDC059881]|uniref:MFS transporter n=1 Tax=Streptomyces sp. NPDC059881 TaxID=3346986 RepID=UPI003654FA46
MIPTSRRPSPGATFLVLAAGALSFAMLQSLIAPVLSTIQSELDTSQSTATWVMTANLLSAAVFTPILGRVGDAVGKKRTLVAVLLTLAVGSLLAALAPDIGVLIAARVVQGAAGAVFPLSYGIIRDEFPAQRVASAVGTMSAVIAAGGGLGIVLAGPIVDTLGYTWLFWTPMAVVTLAAVAAQLFVPESPVRQPGRINWPAAVLLSGGLVSLLLVVGKGGTWGWSSAPATGLAIAAVTLLSLWIVAELRSANPLVDMRMMRIPAVWRTNLVALLFGAGWFAIFAFLPQFVQTPIGAGYGFGAGITEAGVLMLPMVVTMSAAGVVSGRIEHRVGPRAQLVTATALSMLTAVSLAFAHAEPWQIALASAVFGLAAGLAFSSMTNLIVSSVPAQQTGVASGMNANFRTIGGAFGAALMGSVVTSGLQPTGWPQESAYTTGFLVLAATSVAALGAALIVPSVRRATRTSPPDAEGPLDAVSPPDAAVPPDTAAPPDAEAGPRTAPITRSEPSRAR